MKNTSKVIISIATTCYAITMIPCVSASEWIPSNGNSCDIACHLQGNKEPVSPGKYKNGNPFYICRTNAKGEGNRPGFNLNPKWKNECYVYAGKSSGGYSPYDCLCQ